MQRRTQKGHFAILVKFIFTFQEMVTLENAAISWQVFYGHPSVHTLYHNKCIREYYENMQIYLKLDVKLKNILPNTTCVNQVRKK